MVTNKEINLKIISFYRFVEIKDKNKLKLELDNFLKKRIIRGTILLSDEGINGSLSGAKTSIYECLKFIKNQTKIRKIHINENYIDYIPFNRMKVRLKNEIISMGVKEIKVSDFSKNHLSPQDWDKFINNKKIKLIDTRNEYEIQIGKFKNSINPHTKSFRDFTKKLGHLKIKQTDKVGIYCTGGIRCEKAAAYMQLKGFQNVFQLNGGILNYLEYKKKNKSTSQWQGECFVFDNRVTVDSNLNPGKYLQCYGCRMPISKKDTRSKKYLKGVSCPHCYDTRSKEQKNNSQVRQKQIENKQNKGMSHPFKKLKAIDIFK
tara:strand:- start:1108 stop:2061 length:954 start_codon:yes stop_codon:yes gene_type:complete